MDLRSTLGLKDIDIDIQNMQKRNRCTGSITSWISISISLSITRALKWIDLVPSGGVRGGQYRLKHTLHDAGIPDLIQGIPQNYGLQLT